MPTKPCPYCYLNKNMILLLHLQTKKTSIYTILNVYTTITYLIS